MADIVEYLPNYAVCAGIVTAVVLVISFVLWRCVTGKSSDSLAQKSKLKKGKEKKKSPERIQAASKPPSTPKTQTTQDSSEQKIQPTVVPQFQSAAPVVAPNKNRKGNAKVEHAAPAIEEIEVAAVEDDEWVTVKRGKSSRGPQTADAPAKVNQKPKQDKGASKESTPKETKNSQKAKKSAEPRPQRSSDEESPVAEEPNPPKPAVMEPVEGNTIY
ncbi:unnamed protein product [Dibothriocephalus latus]|uniref:Uncharacterized protein n=1 Tax=Dibothriocephalus latus TaxID=60516 RepID=A0A3P7P325_DIBLA|nr:unnamed protein product [Dibothriocephalus latus]